MAVTESEPKLYDLMERCFILSNTDFVERKPNERNNIYNNN